ncbi:ABC transporter ATP-binding protein [Variovorax defluvii]|uniref:ABC transporter ATP-binding protein n=1 Tax=Variovorax defluvii TaxID=913761 RepID=A0ABP8HFD5_9BURK
MLSCHDLNARYGVAHVLFDVSLELRAGRVLSLLGRNGAGKSTLLKTLMGLLPAHSGTVAFEGRRIDGLPPWHVARLGLGYVPEERRIFVDLSVQDNIEVGERAGSPWTRERLYGIFPALREFRKRPAGLLSGGQQQMLTVARTLAGGPAVLLIDEPTEGLAPVMVQTLESVMAQLKREGQTMLVAAQDLRFALSIADDICVMNLGRVVHACSGDDARADAARLRQLFTL